MNSKKRTLSLLAGLAMLGGIGTGLAGVAAAQTTAADTGAIATQAVTTSASASSAQPAASPTIDPTKGGHVGQNGTKEELLTGDLASKATAAALAAVPGATVERVETDAEGAVYEAHMLKADGSRVTVKFDGSFNVTATEDGHGQPPRAQ
jgi:hypothetical protein